MTGMKKLTIVIILFFSFLKTFSSSILIYMDETQKNHLKAYGIAYWVLQNGVNIKWLLNYRGGSFLIPYHKEIADELGVSLEEAEKTILAYLEKYTEKRQNPICGNSVGHDRRVLFREMKKFEDE